jgi:hypothetical protein
MPGLQVGATTPALLGEEPRFRKMKRLVNGKDMIQIENCLGNPGSFHSTKLEQH